MTTADMLHTEGRAEGRTEEPPGSSCGYSPPGSARVPDRARERIASASLEQLRVWSERVLDAETVDQVLA